MVKLIGYVSSIKDAKIIVENIVLERIKTKSSNIKVCITIEEIKLTWGDNC